MTKPLIILTILCFLLILLAICIERAYPSVLLGSQEPDTVIGWLEDWWKEAPLRVKLAYPAVALVVIFICRLVITQEWRQ